MTVSRVAVILLTEAHMAGPAALRHADVVHQPQVDVEAVRAGPADAVAGAADVLDELHAATLALLDGGHVLYGQGVVEWVLAPSINRDK